jgi:hypothetical protein
LNETLRIYFHGNVVPHYNHGYADSSFGSGVESKLVAAKPALQGICARYIAASCTKTASTDSAPEQTEIEDVLLGQDDLDFLAKYGLSHRDVELWASIVTQSDTYQACHQLWMSCANSLDSNRVPCWILLFLLQRKYIPPDGVRLLLDVAWHMLGREELQAVTEDGGNHSVQSGPFVLGNDRKVLLFTSLARHTNSRYPSGLATLSDMISAHLDPAVWVKSNRADRRETRLRKVSYLWNLFLEHLGRPSKIHPYRSSRYQEQAQFNLLRKMGELVPAIPITERGYKALTAVQLRRGKSPQEQDWAKLKTTNWPPWKVSHTALDEDKDRGYGTSRAGQIIDRMREAGYTGGAWSDVSQILAGWDTDGSPTIQTRKVLPRAILGDLDPSSSKYFSLVWQSRIQSTRSVNEAWAGYLAFESNMQNQNQAHGHGHGAGPYIALAEKIYSHSKQAERVSKPGFKPSRRQALPGDGKEVSIAELSPNESVYIPRKPPSIDEIIDTMVERGVHMSSTQLSVMASIAPDQHAFRKCLTLVPGALAGFWTLTNPQTSTVQSKVQGVSGAVFRAVCIFLLTNRHQSFVRRLAYSCVQQHPPPNMPASFVPIYHVWSLLRYRPHNSGLWEQLLRATYASSGLAEEESRYSLQAVQTSVQCSQVMKDMLLDLDESIGHVHPDILIPVCGSLELAIRTSLSIHSKTAIEDESSTSADADSHMDDGNATELNKFIGNTTTYIRQQFYKSLHDRQEADYWARNQRRESVASFTSLSKQHDLPELLTTPRPALLHAYVRCLGMLGDWAGLQNFAFWLSAHWKDLQKAIDEKHGGSAMFRRTLVAMRVMLEGRHSEEVGGREAWARQHMSSPTRNAALRTITKVAAEMSDKWGPWPKHWEVRLYLRNRGDDETHVQLAMEEAEEEEYDEGVHSDVDIPTSRKFE